MRLTAARRVAPRLLAVWFAALLIFASYASVIAADSATPIAAELTSASSPLNVSGSDGFEADDLSAWTSEGVRLQPKYRSEGGHAVRATAKSSPAFLRRALASSQKSLTVQVSVLIKSQDQTRLPLLQLQTAGGDLVLVLSSDAGGHLGLQAAGDDAAATSSAIIGDGKWHTLAAYVQVGKPGIVTVALDGTAIDDISGSHPTGSSSVGAIQLGSNNERHSYDVVFDDLSVTKGKSKEMPSTRGAKQLTTPAATAISRYNDPVLQWLPEIVAASNATGVPPSLIAGVMALESSGYQWEVSVAGAIGLMQVMPDELLAHGVSVDAGFDPATNVMVGARILAERSGAGWEMAVGYYFGIGCDAYGTCTGAYVSVALAWAAVYAPIIGDSFYGNPNAVPASWYQLSPSSGASSSEAVRTTDASTPPPTSAPAKSTATPKPKPTTAPTEPPASVPTEVPTEVPTDVPTEIPTLIPTPVPTDPPTPAPTDPPQNDSPGEGTATS